MRRRPSRRSRIFSFGSVASGCSTRNKYSSGTSRASSSSRTPRNCHSPCFLPPAAGASSVRWSAVGPGGRLGRCRGPAEGGGHRARHRPRSLSLTSWRPPWSAPARCCARLGAGLTSTAAVKSVSPKASRAASGRRARDLRLTAAVAQRLRSLRSLRPGPSGPALAGTAHSPRGIGAAAVRAVPDGPRSRYAVSEVVSSALVRLPRTAAICFTVKVARHRRRPFRRCGAPGTPAPWKLRSRCASRCSLPLRLAPDREPPLGCASSCAGPSPRREPVAMS
jgi:hypothetical protein